ncbi:MAG TPA: hypothetical protein VIT68_00525 [Candidatus Gracilibacteria bacterium]
MNLTKTLHARSSDQCELCGDDHGLEPYCVPPKSSQDPDENILVCAECLDQIEHPDMTDPDHWRCLNDSMWSDIPAVQVVCFRMLTRLSDEGWPQDLLDILYLDDDVLAWAEQDQRKGN